MNQPSLAPEWRDRLAALDARLAALAPPPCPACDGDGEVAHDNTDEPRPCLDCGGSGLA